MSVGKRGAIERAEEAADADELVIQPLCSSIHNMLSLSLDVTLSMNSDSCWHMTCSQT